MSKWIPVSERLPDDWEIVDIYTHGEVLVGLYDSEIKRWREAGEAGYSPVTHWKPRPEPPEKDNGNN